MFEKNMKFPLLLDTYGEMLSERKREVLDYYYNEDYSLSEISELTGISRQGVRDAIKKAEEELYSMEERLGFVRRSEKVSQAVEPMITALRRRDDAELYEMANVLERLIRETPSDKLET